MVRGQGVVAVGLVLAGVFASGAARAQEPAAPARQVEFSAGLLGLLGGNLFTTPSDIPGGYEGLGFAGDAGGFGWGIAAYGEARFIQHLGLEMTIGYDRSNLHRDVTYNGIVKVQESLTIGSPRLGFLAKGILPTPFGRLWLGLGPQFVLSTSTDAKNEITSGREFVPPGDIPAVEGAIHAEETNSTLLDIGGGLAVHAGDLIEIPFELRASKNLSQDSAWLDRVTLHPPGLNYDVKTQSSWEFRMAVGVGVHF